MWCVREVGVRADAGEAVVGAVARSLGLGEAGVTAKARQGLRGDAAGALDEVDDAAVVLAGEGVEVVALDAVDAAEAGGGVEGRVAVAASGLAAEGGDAVVLLSAAEASDT